MQTESAALVAPPHTSEHPRSGESLASVAWSELIADVYGYRVVTIESRSAGGVVRATLPLAVVSSPLGGTRLSGFPFSDHWPLPADEAAAADVVDQALALSKAVGARHLELRAGRHPLLARREDFVANDLYVRWLLPLASDTATVWRKVKKSVQRQVQKAEHAGVTVRFADRREDMRLYHQLHVRTRTRKHGMPAQPLRYFERLWDVFAVEGRVQVLFAEHEGQAVAGIVVLASGSTARYAYGGSDDRYLHLAPNNLLMWTAIKWACERGYTTFDFGRTARDNQGLMQFKRGWGSVEEPLTYYYHPQIAGLAATSERSWKYRVATACWGRLPLPLAAALGGRLYKYLG